MRKNFHRIKESHDACFKICSPTRFKIIAELRSGPDGAVVGEIAKKLGFSLSRVSHQLAILRKYKVVEIERCGKKITYKMPLARVKKRLPCWV